MNAILEHVNISPVNMKARRDIDIRPGDTVRVWTKVTEKGKTRLQAFEGTVLARKHGSEPGATFTVRRVSGGYGVEKIFPLYSPMIDKIEIVRRVKTRRAKLYHIRDKAAREIKRQMRNMRLVSIATQSEQEAAAEAQKKAEEAEAKAVEETASSAPDTVAEGTPAAPEQNKNDTREAEQEDEGVNDKKEE